MKTIFLTFTFLSFLFCQAQNFSKNYVLYDDWDQGMKIVPYEDGFLIQIFGWSGNPSQNISGIFWVDKQGELENTIIFDSLTTENALDIRNSKITFGGNSNDGLKAYKKMYLYQFDLQGNKLIEKKVPTGIGFDILENLIYDNGYYYLNDQIKAYGDKLGQKIYFMDSLKIWKYDTQLNFIKLIFTPFTVPVLINTDLTVHSNNFFVCAISEKDTLSGDIKQHVIAFDSSSQMKWKYNYANNTSIFEKSALSTIAMSNKKTAVLLPYEIDDVIITEQYVVMLDSLGKVKWKHFIDPKYLEGPQEFMNIFKTKSGDLIIVGQQFFVNKNQNRRTGLIMRLDNNGKEKWRRRVWDLATPFGHSGFKNGVELDDGSLLITGWWRDTIGEPQKYDTDIWLIKLDSNGCYNPGCTGDDIVTSNHSVVLLNDQLIKLTPNPATDQLSCSWNKTPGSVASIKIFDLKGTEIKRFTVPRVSDNMDLDIGNLLEGMYLVKIFGDGWESMPEKFVKY